MYPHQAERLTGTLARGGLDALVATTPANIAYISGFRSLARPLYPQRPYFAVFSGRGTALIVPGIDAPTVAVEQPAADHVRCYGAFVYARGPRSDETTRRVHELMAAAAPTAEDALAEALAGLGIGGGTVGLDEAGLSAPIERQVTERLVPATVVPAGALLAAARAVKAPWEIECLDRALRTAEEAVNAVVQVLKPGMTEREAVGLYVEEVARRGAEPCVPVILFGERSAFPVVGPSDRALRRGDLVRIDLGCVWKGYHADLGRTAVMGEPAGDQQRAFDAILAGLQAATEAIRPGAPAGTLFERAIEAVRGAGLPHYDRHHVGHGIGLEATEPPWFERGSATPLEMGMVVRVETPYYEPGWGGLHLKDTLLVTSHGQHVMNRSLRGLVVLD
jgi:Xaa-Pro dipeptidase